MPTAYVLDPVLHLVRSRAWGVLTETESFDHYREIADDPGLQPAFGQICDLRDVERINVSTEAIRGLAQTAVFAPGVRRAFVAADDVQFGLTRMLQAFCEFEGTKIGVFRTMVEAEERLKLEPGSLL